MAEGFAKEILPSGYNIVSAGTKPSAEVNPNAITVMAELGINISDQFPKMLENKMLKDASHFISMGCGVIDGCPVPLVPGEIEILDWDLEDPVGKDIDFFRKTRDIIKRKVENLKEDLGTNRLLFFFKFFFFQISVH